MEGHLLTDKDKIKLAKEVLDEQLNSKSVDYTKLSTAKTILDSIFARVWLKQNGIKVNE
jgi:hypothetical protein